MITMPAESPLHRVFCHNVRVRRAQLGLTQKEVAVAMGVTQSTYSSIESGKAVPSLDIVERVSKALTLPPSLLLAGQTGGKDSAQAG